MTESALGLSHSCRTCDWRGPESSPATMGLLCHDTRNDEILVWGRDPCDRSPGGRFRSTSTYRQCRDFGALVLLHRSRSRHRMASHELLPVVIAKHSRFRIGSPLCLAHSLLGTTFSD